MPGLTARFRRGFPFEPVGGGTVVRDSTTFVITRTSNRLSERRSNVACASAAASVRSNFLTYLHFAKGRSSYSFEWKLVTAAGDR